MEAVAEELVVKQRVIVRMDDKKRIPLGPILTDLDGPFFELGRTDCGKVFVQPILPTPVANAALVAKLNEFAFSLLKPSQFATVKKATTQQLINVAVDRGCLHYKAFGTTEHVPAALQKLPSELIGVALLRGDVSDSFNAIRIGAMLLSSEKTNTLLAWIAALTLGVAPRLRYIADLAVENTREQHWKSLQGMLPTAEDDSRLPGLSRFVSETRFPQVIRIWLKPAP